jgi:protein phosphatase 2C family protein 2/3
VTITDQDQFLLLACDGLFDVYTPEEIVTFVKNGMEKHGDTQRCCQVENVFSLHLFLILCFDTCF